MPARRAPPNRPPDLVEKVLKPSNQVPKNSSKIKAELETNRKLQAPASGCEVGFEGPSRWRLGSLKGRATVFCARLGRDRR